MFSKIRIFVLAFIGYLVFLVFPFNIVNAADSYLYVSPSNNTFAAGDKFSVSVIVHAGGEKVCGVEGVLSFENLSCQSISTASGIQAQSSANCAGGGFLLGIQGCVTTDKTLFTINLKAGNAGAGKVGLNKVEIIGEDGPLSYSASGGSFTITDPCSCSAFGSWQDGACGASGCLISQRSQTRKRDCSPDGCDSEQETQCVEDSSCSSSQSKINILPPSNTKTEVVSDEQEKSVKISWNLSKTKDITGYYILRRLSEEKYYKTIKIVDKNITEYIDGTVEEGKTYDYAVVAYKGNWANRSSFSQKTGVVVGGDGEEEKQEIEIDLSVDEQGKIISDFHKEIFKGKVFIKIFKDTVVSLGESGILQKQIKVSKVQIQDIENADENFIQETFYNFTPDGIKFSREIEIGIKYNPEVLPENVNEKDVTVKFFSEDKWVSLPTEIDEENHIAIVKVDHFTLFGLFIETEKVKGVSKIPTKTSFEQEDDLNFSLFSVFWMIFSALIITGLWIYYKKQKKNQEKLNNSRVLEFLIFGVLVGILENIILVSFISGIKIDWQIIGIMFLIVLPFAVLTELIVDHPRFWKIFFRRNKDNQ